MTINRYFTQKENVEVYNQDILCSSFIKSTIIEKGMANHFSILALRTP